jgi:hypothetical protein
MSRTKRAIPAFCTPRKMVELEQTAKNLKGLRFNSVRDPFFNGFDKLGRKTPIFDHDLRDEVWGEKNKRYARNRMARKVRRQGKVDAVRGRNDY